MSSRKNYLFTSESVSEGHPDKVCDRISDSIVDLFLKHMPEARVALETLATTNRVVLAGEVRGPDAVGHEQMIETARMAIKDIGYDQEGFDWRKARIECLARGHNFIAQLLAALRIAEDLLRRAPGIERRNQPQPGSGIGFSPRYLRHVAGGMAQRIEVPHGDHGNHQQQSQHGTKRNKQTGTDAPMVQGREKFEHAHSTLKEIKKVR